MTADGGARDYNEPPVDPRPNAMDCPYCGAYTALKFQPVGSLAMRVPGGDHIETTNCASCNNNMIWLNSSLIYPLTLAGPPPSGDMPELVGAEYDEARRVANESPRAAAALLRLAIQKLVDELQSGKGTLDDKIGLLVEGGEIRPKLADMLDVVRVTGNDAVHPGQINLNEEPERVDTLFRLVNAIVEQTISMDKLIGDAKATLPESDLAGIDQRSKRVKGKFNLNPRNTD